MTVTCRPTLPAVARVVSVLHARRAQMTGLRYRDGSIVVDLQGGDAARLAAQVRRIVDVWSVRVVAVPLAVAS